MTQLRYGDTIKRTQHHDRHYSRARIVLARRRLMEKRCAVCNQVKPITEFHKNSKTKDGCAARCKPCACQATMEWKVANRERYAESLRSWKERNRERKRRNNRRWARDNHEKVLAQRQLNAAIHSGKIDPATQFRCSNSECPNMAIDYHHWSYADEHIFSVIPLCRGCHTRLHSGAWQIATPELFAIQFKEEITNG